MIDRRHIGYTTAPTRVPVEAWRVQLFCRAIGETSPVHWDEAAARRAGHAGCPVPPTFLKALETEHCSSATLLQQLQVSVGRVLHAEQSFSFLRPVHVGDEVEITRSITDLYDKRDGALSFVVVQTRYGVGGQDAASSVQTILVRNG
ncbi:MAG TPA: MaoC family dehydratase N-terminal domain-containing protein [Methylibium sp.]|nr:MaoC family dehydratase N-terminal domain-containing protein [Methylibium sp.]